MSAILLLLLALLFGGAGVVAAGLAFTAVDDAEARVAWLYAVFAHLLALAIAYFAGSAS